MARGYCMPFDLSNIIRSYILYSLQSPILVELLVCSYDLGRDFLGRRSDYSFMADPKVSSHC